MPTLMLYLIYKFINYSFAAIPLDFDKTKIICYTLVQNECLECRNDSGLYMYFFL